MSASDDLPLARFTVLEVNDRDVPLCLRLAASLAGKIAADLGATVLKIEPPEGVIVLAQAIGKCGYE